MKIKIKKCDICERYYDEWSSCKPKFKIKKLNGDYDYFDYHKIDMCAVCQDKLEDFLFGKINSFKED